jgi:RHS repeat-associated protein
VYYYLGTKMVGERKGNYSSGNGQFRIVGDHLGSTTLTVDIAFPPSVVYRAYYKPYGEVAFQSGTSLTSVGYTGQRLDGDSGLMYYGARYYDPVLSYFISSDINVPGVPQLTLGFRPNQPASQGKGVESGSSLSINRFSYTLNNPIKYDDPNGHEARFTPPGSLPATYYAMLNYTYHSMLSTIGAYGSPDPTLERIRNGNAGIPGTYPAPQNPDAQNSPLYQQIAAATEWASQVKEGGEWDMKSQLSWAVLGRDHKPHDPSDDIYFHLPNTPRHVQTDFNVFGNMWYGFVGASAGFLLPVLQGGAWAVDISAYGTSNPQDIEAVTFGYNLYIKYAGHLDDLTYEKMSEEFLANAARMTHSRLDNVE